MTTEKTPIAYSDLLKYVDLQMAAEAFLANEATGTLELNPATGSGNGVRPLIYSPAGSSLKCNTSPPCKVSR